jgi:NTP pyrophosphatase (non-canonical NTP hydrolase)
MQNIVEIVEAYYQYRGLENPDASQALMFLVSEIGELADAHVANQAKWVRNNDRERNVDEEIGDVLMMLTVYASTRGIDPIAAMLKKFERKGFSPSQE